MKLKCYLPLPLKNVQIGHTFLEICSNMHNNDIEPLLYVFSNKTEVNNANIRPFVHSPLKYLPYKFLRKFNALNEKKFLNQLIHGDIVYLWSDASESFVKKIKNKGIYIIREKINCAQRFSKKILDDEYLRLGISPQHSITYESIVNEESVFMYSDFIFSPSPMVSKSLLTVGISNEKIIESSYGWDPKRLLINNNFNDTKNSKVLTILFCGFFCVRKGAHLLLNIWKELKLDANLVICGNIDPIIQELFQEELKDTRIIKTGFVYNVSDFYSSADIFILPTLEEGSPMVTYEAMAHGLPVILSEMGAGPIARNEIDGFIIDPHNSSEFKNALIRLLTDTKLRKDMGINAYNRAQEFTWGKVGLKRANILSEKLSLN